MTNTDEGGVCGRVAANAVVSGSASSSCSSLTADASLAGPGAVVDVAAAPRPFATTRDNVERSSGAAAAFVVRPVLAAGGDDDDDDDDADGSLSAASSSAHSCCM